MQDASDLGIKFGMRIDDRRHRLCSCFGRLIHRAASIGVSVNETISETAIAAADVSPNDDMNRPTMPVINPTGMNTASSESVVAKTARPISRVPSIAARNGSIPFSSTKR